MAITFPRDFPGNGVFTDPQPFEPVYQQSQALAGSGSTQVADLGPQMWRGKFSTQVQTREAFDLWDAWLASLGGGLRLFKGRPPNRRWPLAYPAGFAGILYLGSQWSGLGNLSVIGAQRDTVTINQIPTPLVLKPGDWFSIPVGTKQHLHKVTEGGTSVGNAITVSVTPTIRPNVVTGIAVRLDTPYCEMVLEDGKYSAVRNGRGGSISFNGIQVLI